MNRIISLTLLIFSLILNCIYAQDNMLGNEEQNLKTIASFSSNNLFLSLTTISVIKQNIKLDQDTSLYSNYSEVIKSVVYTLEDGIKKLGDILEKQKLTKDDNKFIKELIKTLYSMKEDSNLLLKYLNSKNEEDFNKFNVYHNIVTESVERLYSTKK